MKNTKAIFIAVTIGVVVLVGGTAVYHRWRLGQQLSQSSATQPGVEANAPTLVSPSEDEKLKQEAQTCLHEAIQRLNNIAADQPDHKGDIELDKDWLEYLQQIQAERSFPNWSDKPCDLYLKKHPRDVAQATALGLVTIDAQGNGLKTVSVTVTATVSNPVFFLPVGTLFTSSSGGTQSMITATTVPLVFHPVEQDNNTTFLSGAPLSGGPKVQPAVFQLGRNQGFRQIASTVGEQVAKTEVETFCVNRWLKIPESDTSFSVSEPDPNDSRRKLVACLEHNPTGHFAKQMAVWMVSDRLIDISQQEFENKLFAEMEEESSSLEQFLQSLQRESTPLSEEELRQLQKLTPAEFEEIRDKVLRSEAHSQVKNYVEVTQPLLEGCGIDLSGSTFFH